MDDLKHFKNLRSLLWQFIYANQKLDDLSVCQKDHAKTEISDRFIQLKSLIESNTEMACLLKNAQKVQLLDASLTIQQQEGLYEIVSHLPKIQHCLDVLSLNLRNNLDSLQLGESVIIEDIDQLGVELQYVLQKCKDINMVNREDQARKVAAQCRLKEIKALCLVQNGLVAEIESKSKQIKLSQEQHIFNQIGLVVVPRQARMEAGALTSTF